MVETLLANTGIAPTELRYLALGDSYTIGEGVAESGRWPVQLARSLRNDGIPMSEPRIIAQTGWTTDELDAAIDTALVFPEYDLVSLLIGVNNQYRGRDIEEYRVQFSGLLERAIHFAQGRRDRVLVLSIPDWGVTPFARGLARDTQQVAREIDAFNAVALETCMRRGVVFVDITDASRQRDSETDMLADDGLHPSALMYAEWARLALPAVQTMQANP